MWHALSDVDLANSVQFLLLDTGLAICYCKFINSGKGARAKYRFVWAFLYPWIAAVGNILVLQDKGVLNHCFMV